MKLTVAVRLDGQFNNEAIDVEIPEPFGLAFESIDQCDDTTTLLVYGMDAARHNQRVERVLKLRPDAAYFIAKNITELLLEHMKSKDTVSGYRVKREGVLNAN